MIAGIPAGRKPPAGVREAFGIFFRQEIRAVPGKCRAVSKILLAKGSDLYYS
jgi:hypothetical protein